MAFHNFGLGIDSLVIKYGETKADMAGDVQRIPEFQPDNRGNWERKSGDQRVKAVIEKLKVEIDLANVQNDSNRLKELTVKHNSIV